MSEREIQLLEQIKKIIDEKNKAKELLKRVIGTFEDVFDEDNDLPEDPYRIKYEKEHLIQEIEIFLGDE